MRRLTTGIRSEKCVVKRFRRCANVIECTYTNLDSVDKKPTRCHLSFISLLQVAQHVSANHVRSRQLLKMGTWLPETC